MEKKRTIEELTSALGSLKLQEANLTAQLREAVEEKERSEKETDQTRETEIHPFDKGEGISDETKIRGFAKGDRIWIINSVNKPASWDNNTLWRETRSATVTEVLIKGPVVQVHFTTDNGVSTWRAPNNIGPLNR
jgi:hypothetical protein